MEKVWWDIILPIKDSEGRIIDWRMIAWCRAYDADTAIRFAKREYGIEADVRKPKVWGE